MNSLYCYQDLDHNFKHAFFQQFVTINVGMQIACYALYKIHPCLYFCSCIVALVSEVNFVSWVNKIIAHSKHGFSKSSIDICMVILIWQFLVCTLPCESSKMVKGLLLSKNNNQLTILKPCLQMRLWHQGQQSVHHSLGNHVQLPSILYQYLLASNT